MFWLGFICAFLAATGAVVALFAWDEWRDKSSLAARVEWLEGAVDRLEDALWAKGGKGE